MINISNITKHTTFNSFYPISDFAKRKCGYYMHKVYLTVIQYMFHKTHFYVSYYSYHYIWCVHISRHIVHTYHKQYKSCTLLHIVHTTTNISLHNYLHYWGTYRFSFIEMISNMISRSLKSINYAHYIGPRRIRWYLPDLSIMKRTLQNC